MSKRDFRRVGRYEPDPGAVVVVPNTTRPYIDPKVRKAQAKKRAIEDRELRMRRSSARWDTEQAIEDILRGDVREGRELREDEERFLAERNQIKTK